jgi:hypothetical protein
VIYMIVSKSNTVDQMILDAGSGVMAAAKPGSRAWHHEGHICR